MRDHPKVERKRQPDLETLIHETACRRQGISVQDSACKAFSPVVQHYTSNIDMSANTPALPVLAELLLQIFVLLPSLPDALSLATTCRQLRGVWINNVNTIYMSIAPKTILCHHSARRLLAGSDAPPPELPLTSPDDVRSILHTSRIVEKAIVQFEREVVPKVRCKLALYHFLRRGHNIRLTFSSFLSSFPSPSFIEKSNISFE